MTEQIQKRKQKRREPTTEELQVEIKKVEAERLRRLLAKAAEFLERTEEYGKG